MENAEQKSIKKNLRQLGPGIVAAATSGGRWALYAGDR